MSESKRPILSRGRWIGVYSVFAIAAILLILFWHEFSAAAAPFITAIVLAYIFTPAVNWLQRKICRGRRVLAVAVFYLIGATILIPGTAIVGTLVVSEAVNLINRENGTAEEETVETSVEEQPTDAKETPWYISILPESVEQMIVQIREVIIAGISTQTIAQEVLSAVAYHTGMSEEELREKAIQSAGDGISSVAKSIGNFAIYTGVVVRAAVNWAISWTGGAIRFAFNAGMVLVILFYVLIDLDVFGRNILRILPPISQQEVLRIWRLIDTQWSAFLRGQVTVALIVGILGAVIYPLVGVDFGVLIGLLAGFCNIVPYLGPATGALLAVGSTIIEQAPQGLGALGWQLGLVVCAFTAIQWLEGFVVTPYVMSEAVDLHPMLIFFVLVLGGSIAGVVGMLLAVPATCAARVLIRELYLNPLEEHARASGFITEHSAEVEGDPDRSPNR